MPKTKISEFSATPANNTDIDSINIAEGCAPSGINDAIRELMAQLKDFQTGAVGDSFNGPVGTTTAAAGAFTTLSSTGNTTLGDASGDSVTINGTATFANANPTLSAGTANGVAYLNGSKVVTSGSALTFDGTNLANTGNITAGTTGSGANLVAYASTYTSNGMVRLFGTDGNNKVEFGAASATTAFLTARAGVSMIFGANDAEGMRLTSTGLGIGTSSPAYKLDVNGNAQVGNATAGTNRYLYINGVANKAGGIIFQESGAAKWYIGNGAASENGNFEIYNALGNNTVITPAGNLGLGVTPSAWGTLTAMQVKNAHFGGYINNGYFGANCYYTGSAWNYIGTGTAHRMELGNGQFQWHTAASGTAGNAITFTQAMTLDSSGNLRIGTTSHLLAFNRRLTVYGDAGIEAVVTGTGGEPCVEMWQQHTSGNNVFSMFYTEGTATARGSITYNRAGGLVAYNTTSDYRAKDISGPVTNSGALIDSTPVYMGKMKGATQERPMFIAHETPDYAHTGEKDAVDADGNPVYQQMDASALIPVMWAEIQSLRKRLADAGL